jgi:hypothetical protein
MFKRALIPLAAVAMICGGVAAVAQATRPAGPASAGPVGTAGTAATAEPAATTGAENVQVACVADPRVTDLGTEQQISVVCTVPKPPPVTVTVTASPTTSASPSATSGPSATSSPSQTPTPTVAPTPSPTSSPTATPPPSPSGCVQPNATNTGATGTLAAYNGPRVIDTPGTVVENKQISGDIVITAPNVVVRNSRSDGIIYIHPGGDNAVVSNVNGKGVTVSSANGALIERNNMINDSGDDTFHVTSDQGAYVDTITIRGNYVHDPSVANSHYDALQVRGASNLLVECNTFDLGRYNPEFNAAVYLENDNGGYSNARVVNNWLLGGAFNVMLGGANDGGVILDGNKMGGDVGWGLCMAQDPSSKPAQQSGNTLNGVPVKPCT